MVGFDFSTRKQVVGGSEVLRPESRRVRLGAISCIALLWCGLIVARLYSLQISDKERWQEWAIKQHFADIEIASERGPILDRNGKLFAISVPADSIYIRPKQISDQPHAAVDLARILGMDPKAVKEKLSEAKPFVWLKRQVPREVGSAVKSLGIKGVGTILESRRVYPFNQSASALIGKVGIDGVGLSGIEAIYERDLHGDQVRTRAPKDAFGNIIQIGYGSELSPPKGDSLQLTLDSGLQLIVDEELQHGRDAANAERAVAIMADARTGEILAMSQAPTANFNSTKPLSKDEMKNLAVEAVFEPGSIMKPIVAAAALEAGVIKGGDLVNCENGKYPFARHVIKDVHPSAIIPFFDVVVRSSNIGMTKVGLRLGKERLYHALKSFGFGDPSGLGLPGESSGILRNVNSWADIDVATHSFGQGVAVTPLQMVRAMSAIANGGEIPDLRIIASEEAPKLERVVSAHVAAQVREMLYGVVEDEHGTGTKALIEGVRIGGKTGTAQKARKDGKGYDPGAYVASFVGFADARAIGVDRLVTLMVMVDEPHTNTIYGGTIAAPIFQKIMQRSLHLLATREELVVPKAPAAVPNPGVLAATFQRGSSAVGLGGI